MKKILSVVILLLIHQQITFSFIKIWETKESNFVSYSKFSLDGKKLLIIRNNELKFINSDDGTLDRKIQLPDSIRSFSLSPDETKILCCLKDSLKLVSLIDGASINTFQKSTKSNYQNLYSISEDNNGYFEINSTLTTYNQQTNASYGYGTITLRSLTDGSIIKTILDSNSGLGVIQSFVYKYPNEYYVTFSKWINNDSQIVNSVYKFNSSIFSSFYTSTANNYYSPFPNNYYEGIQLGITDFGFLVTKYGTSGPNDWNYLFQDYLWMYIWTDDGIKYFDDYFYQGNSYILYIVDNFGLGQSLVLATRTGGTPPHLVPVESMNSTNLVYIETSPSTYHFATFSQDGLVTMWQPSISSVETNSEENKPALAITPNPASDNVSISYSGLGFSNPVVSIINSLGVEVKRMVDSQLSENNSIKISIKELPDGIYFCSLNTGNQTLTKSFVVIH